VQLDLSAKEVARLDSLRDSCGLRSRSDVVRSALAVIDWIATESREGRKVVAMGDGLMSELVMPGVTKGVLK
jgi:hypothetical protein